MIGGLGGVWVAGSLERDERVEKCYLDECSA